MRSRRVSTTPACRSRSLWRGPSCGESKRASKRKPANSALTLRPVTRGRRYGLISLVVIGAVIAGVMLTTRPSSVRQPSAAVPSPVIETPAAAPGPDLGSLDDDIGSVLVASWRGTEITPAVRSLLDDGRV